MKLEEQVLLLQHKQEEYALIEQVRLANFHYLPFISNNFISFTHYINSTVATNQTTSCLYLSSDFL
jgi:hypothetical protein